MKYTVLMKELLLVKRFIPMKSVVMAPFANVESLMGQTVDNYVKLHQKIKWNPLSTLVSNKNFGRSK